MARTRFFRNVRRLGQILDVLAKYGFGTFVDRTGLDRSRLGSRLFRTPDGKELHDVPAAVRFRKVLEELGPTFVKFGQILSTRPDLLPPRYCNELRKLQDHVPPFPFEEVKAAVEGDLKKPLEEIFRHFSPKPAAAASLAQVHLATLLDGKKVVVKVQRPRVKEIIDEDLDILTYLARLANRYVDELKPYNPSQMVQEFRQAILKELDFTIEARNTERIREMFKDDATVYVPQVYPAHSSQHVMVMERIEGIKLSDMRAIEKAGLDRKQLAINGANAFLKQIFVYGFFHADPHPGNLFALEGNCVAFIDFGMVGRLHKETKEQIAGMLVGIATRDTKRLLQAAVALGAIKEDAPLQRLSWELEDLLDRYYVSSLKSLKLGDALKDLLEVMAHFEIRMPPEMTMLSKTLITIEGVGEMLDPDFDMVGLTQPFAQKLAMSRFDPGNLLKDARELLESLYSLAVTLPRDLQWVLNKLKQGTLTIELQLKGLEKLIQTLDKVTNRLAFSVVIAALIIGSSIVVMADKGPFLFGYPAFGMVGYITAGVMGLWLVISILRSGRF